MDVIRAALVAQPRFELLSAPRDRGHSTISMPSHATSIAAPRELGALGGILIEDRIGVVHVDQDLARALRQTLQPLEHAARTALRQMTDVACALVREPETDHLVIRPERAVHEHAGGGLHAAPDVLVHGAESRRIERRCVR